MTITTILIDGRARIEGIHLIESHRADYLEETVRKHAHLLDATAPLTLGQLAQRIEAGARSLRAQVTAHYLRTMEEDAQRHALDPDFLRTA